MAMGKISNTRTALHGTLHETYTRFSHGAYSTHSIHPAYERKPAATSPAGRKADKRGVCHVMTQK
jgi:hypothetical protein